MRKPSIIEVIIMLLISGVLVKTVVFPDWKLGCDGWHEYKRVS